MERGVVAVCPSSLSTCTVKLAVSSVVGVPEISPVEPFRLKPAGNDVPEASDQVYGRAPPEAWTVELYERPTYPPGRDVVVMLRAVVIWMERAAVPFNPTLVAWTVKLAVSSVVGVPEISPVLGLRLRPAGRSPEITDHV
jgi:hypothetical protein